MSLFNSFSEFFELLFFGSDPELLKKKDLRKIEIELRSLSPVLLRNRMVLPVFAEGLYVVYQNTRGILTILQETIFNKTNNIAANYIDLLISTGFSYEDCMIIKSIQYETRKEAVKVAESERKEFDKQRASLDKLLHDILNSQQMHQIEVIILRLFQLYDICNFDYGKFLKFFDHEFSVATPDHKTAFRQAELFELDQTLLDLGFVITGFTITTSLVKAVIVLEEQRRGKPFTENEKKVFFESFKKIAAVFGKIITPENITKLLCVLKSDPKFQPEVNKYEHAYVQEYAQRMKQMFEAEEYRIQNELKDERLSADLSELFASKELIELTGYNNENNAVLQRTSTQLFMWITPMQILKSFVHYFITKEIFALLNDVVVEGLFANANLQSSFGASVFHCSEIMNRVTIFEESFKKDGENDFSSILRLAANSKNNPDLTKQLLSKMAGINTYVKNMLRTDMSGFTKLTRNIKDIFVDAKKGSPEMITNIRMVLYSARNKDAAAALERNLQYWCKFIEMMKNYIIFTDKE